MINPYTIKICNDFSDGVIQVIQENGEICGLRWGSRIFPYERKRQKDDGMEVLRCIRSC